MQHLLDDLCDVMVEHHLAESRTRNLSELHVVVDDEMPQHDHVRGFHRANDGRVDDEATDGPPR